MHTSAIRDVRTSPNHDGLVITGISHSLKSSCQRVNATYLASTDQTLRIASTGTNSAIASLKLAQAAWTCCWHHEQPVYLFAGLTNHR
jgi:hypothetical protein